ncbi:MAG: hypothetical protein SPL55_03885 [Prevotella sp.]|nr:hypothetical protein [Prevotella sp.]
MKKMLLFVVAMLTAATSFAQSYEIEDPTWTKTINDVVDDVSDVYVNAPLVITNQGDVVKTGTFTQAFEFAGKELEPIAKSAYILKYDKNGNEVWGNALQGAATVTAITADEAGNVFVAGVFADKVIITSIDGKTVEINGMDGETAQVSGFIASFDKDGKLLAHKTVIPEVNWDLFYAALANEGFYLYDAQFRINHMVAAGEKVYFTVRYASICNIDDVQLVGKIFDMFGMQSFCFDLNNFAAIQLDKDLSNAKLLANVSTTDEAVSGELQMEPQDMNLTVDGDNVFVAWTGTGDLTMEVGNESMEYSFEYGYDAQEHPFVVVNATAEQAEVFHAPASEKAALMYKVADMKVVEGKLYIAGTFIGALPFDNAITSTSACDAFLAALNPDDLTVIWAQNSGIDEGDEKKFYESVLGLEVSDIGVVSSIVNTIDMGKNTIVRSNLFAFEPEGRQVLVLTAPSNYTALSTGIAGAAFNSNVGTSTTLCYFADDDFVQGIENIENGTLNIENGAIFNLQGQRVGKTQKGVFIQNGKKVVVK